MKISKLFAAYVVLALGLVPLLFNPLVIDAFGAGKQSLLLAMGAAGLVMWAVSSLLEKQGKVYWSKWLSWWVLLLVVGGLSQMGAAVGLKNRSWVYPWGLGSMVTVAMWLFLVLQVRSEKLASKLFGVWSITGLVLSAVNLALFLIPVTKLPMVITKANPILSIGLNFSTFGLVLVDVLFLGLMVAQVAKSVWEKYQQGENYIVKALVLAGLAVGLVLGANRMLKSGQIMLDMGSAWVIGVETLKLKPVLGMGLGNYLEAFNKYRPTSFNSSAAWSGVFNFAPMAVLQMWTEMGILGLVMMIMIVFMALKFAKHLKNKWYLLLLALVLLLAPLNLSLVLVTVVALGVLDGERKGERELVLKVGESGLNIMPAVLSLLMVIVAGVVVFYSYKPVRAAYEFRKSLILASKNDAVGTYNKQVQVLTVQPNSSEYRLSYSQTNLAIAQGILQNTKGAELSAEQKQQLSTLLGQAVSEAKTAVALEPNNPSYWANLGSIYRSMVGIVDGSFDFALQSFGQATVLDPTNSLLKIDLGGLYYAAGNYEAAGRVFEEAVKANPSLANAWYNWAYSDYQVSKQNTANVNMRGQKLSTAVQYLQQALALVPVDSGDFDKASKELNSWKEELSELAKKQQDLQQQLPTPKPAETLSVPEKIDSSKVGKEEKVSVSKDQLEPPKP